MVLFVALANFFSAMLLLTVIRCGQCELISEVLQLETDAKPLTDRDFDNAAHLTKDQMYSLQRVSLYAVNHNKDDIRERTQKRVRRNGVSRIAKLWPAGRIPYTISPKYNLFERALLARAIHQYHDKTCIRFEPKSDIDLDYLFIGKVDGCFSDVGRTGGLQILSLDDGCMEYPTIIHEMMHVVGFYHEHERWDRDSHIKIVWDNIDKEAYDQFGRVDLTKTSYYGQNYDYKSILHYDSLAFSKNGYPTLIPTDQTPVDSIGNALDFSSTDLAKINRMYQCHSPQRDLPVQADYSAPSNDCIDTTRLCWLTKDRCNAPPVIGLMKKFCARTCNFCY